MSEGLTSLHKKTYGNWNRAPDPERCAHEVWSGNRGFTHYQCHRKRGYGPEGAFCKQHDPAAKAKRTAKAEARFNARLRGQRAIYGKKFIEALRQIADGHNDPRGLARETLEKHLDD